jgi:hypothetical protein
LVFCFVYHLRKVQWSSANHWLTRLPTVLLSVRFPRFSTPAFYKILVGKSFAGHKFLSPNDQNALESDLRQTPWIDDVNVSCQSDWGSFLQNRWFLCFGPTTSEKIKVFDFLFQKYFWKKLNFFIFFTLN